MPSYPPPPRGFRINVDEMRLLGVEARVGATFESDRLDVRLATYRVLGLDAHGAIVQRTSWANSGSAGRAEPASQLEARRPAQARPRGASGRVLVVDDDLEILRRLREVLSDTGYDVTIASSGAEALMLLGDGAEPPDLVLIDATMPAMSGLELAARVREHARSHAVPIVMMSTDARAEIAEEVDAFLPKPVKTSQLLQIVHRTLTVATMRNATRKASGTRRQVEPPGDEQPAETDLERLPRAR